MAGEHRPAARLYCRNGKCPLNYISGSFAGGGYRCPQCGKRLSDKEGKDK